MMRLMIGVSFWIVTGLFSGATRADDQPQKKAEPELLPAPKVIQPPATIIIEPYYERQDTRNVWQHYGVNSYGRFVPRVINTPYGYYYSRNLEPYPWAGTRPRAFVP